MLVKKYWLLFSDFQDTRPGIKDHIAVAGIFCPSEDRKYIDSIRVHFTLLCTFTGVHLDPVDRNLCVCVCVRCLCAILVFGKPKIQNLNKFQKRCTVIVFFLFTWRM